MARQHGAVTIDLRADTLRAVVYDRFGIEQNQVAQAAHDLHDEVRRLHRRTRLAALKAEPQHPLQQRLLHGDQPATAHVLA